jgi:hypothetical protein
MRYTTNGWKVKAKLVAWPTRSPAIRHLGFFYPWHLLQSVVCATAVNEVAEQQQMVEEH